MALLMRWGIEAEDFVILMRACVSRTCVWRSRGGRWGWGVEEGWFLFWFWFWMTRPRLQHSRRGTQKVRGSQPPQGGLLGPAMVGRSGRPVAAPRASGGRYLPSFVGGGSAFCEGRGCRGGAGNTCARAAEWLAELVRAGSVRWGLVRHNGVHEGPLLHALPQHVSPQENGA